MINVSEQKSATFDASRKQNSFSQQLILIAVDVSPFGGPWNEFILNQFQLTFDLWTVHETRFHKANMKFLIDLIIVRYTFLLVEVY